MTVTPRPAAALFTRTLTHARGGGAAPRPLPRSRLLRTSSRHGAPGLQPAAAAPPPAAGGPLQPARQLPARPAPPRYLQGRRPSRPVYAIRIAGPRRRGAAPPSSPRVTPPLPQPPLDPPPAPGEAALAVQGPRTKGGSGSRSAPALRRGRRPQARPHPGPAAPAPPSAAKPRGREEQRGCERALGEQATSNRGAGGGAPRREAARAPRPRGHKGAALRPPARGSRAARTCERPPASPPPPPRTAHGFAFVRSRRQTQRTDASLRKHKRRTSSCRSCFTPRPSPARPRQKTNISSHRDCDITYRTAKSDPGKEQIFSWMVYISQLHKRSIQNNGRGSGRVGGLY